MFQTDKPEPSTGTSGKSSTASSSSMPKARRLRNYYDKFTVSLRSFGETCSAWRGLPWTLIAATTAILLLTAARTFGQGTGVAAGSVNVDVVNLEQLALLAYTAAKSGEWRMLLAVGLLASVAGVRWATKKFKAELEEKEWYREWVLPLLPVLLGVFAATGTDVLAGKPFGASLWRGLNIGLMAGGAYKAFLKPAQGLFSKVFGSKVKTATLSQAVAAVTEKKG